MLSNSDANSFPYKPGIALINFLSPKYTSHLELLWPKFRAIWMQKELPL